MNKRQYKKILTNYRKENSLRQEVIYMKRHFLGTLENELDVLFEEFVTPLEHKALRRYHREIMRSLEMRSTLYLTKNIPKYARRIFIVERYGWIVIENRKAWDKRKNKIFRGDSDEVQDSIRISRDANSRRSIRTTGILS